MSIFDQTSKDLKSSRLVIHKLGETFTDFQTRTYSAISLCEQWRTLQGSFAKIHNSFEERVKEVEAKEREIDMTRKKLYNLGKEVELWKKKLDSEEKSLRERIDGVGLREKEVRELRESLELEKRLLGERCKEGFERVKEKMKAVEDRVEEMELKAKVMSERGEALDAKEKELSMKESVLEQKKVKFEEDMNGMDELYFALERKEKENDEQSSMLMSKEKMLGLKEKEIDERGEMLEAKEKSTLEDAKAMELERKQLQAKELEIESKENKLNDQLKCDGHQILSNCQAQEYEEKRIGTKFFSSSLSIGGEQIRSYCIKMDALFLGFCITDQVKAKTILPKEILDALRYAPDPGKLVMKVTRTFHQNFSDKDTTTIYKDSCILLLEQLMKLSPPIMDNVKEEARDLAFTLKAAKNITPTDNFGFLQFVAAFKLANCFNADDLVTFFGSFYRGVKIYRLEQLASLCSALGLSDKIPGLIKSCIQKKKLLTAVKCICIFKLEDKFPPEPLLENYLDMSNKKVNKKRKAGTFIPKIEAIDKELSILRDVTSCIATFKLESRFPPEPLLSRIEELLKAKEERKAGALTHWINNKRSASSCDSIASQEQLQKRPKIEK
ncbi:FRIGIDA-like protein 5 [Chenopodium quinoa]|uniref:FRIGIDA-like protein 5 n=1 Tax=Chenopodium quinoa TaxID=63459 RepID=UPI000B78C53F|nr:FRIGIDA-like protein 5 [Chenopodium quinoa]